MQNEKQRETLWVYYKYSTKTTRATLRQHVGSKLEYVQDTATTDLAAAIYKAWVSQKGELNYPRLLVLPRGVYQADGSGSSFGEDAERDVSYHLIDKNRAQRILRYNGDTLWQSAKSAIHRKTRQFWRKVSIWFVKKHSESINEPKDLPVPTKCERESPIPLGLG